MRAPDPWRWPICTAVAMTLLLLGVFFTPRSWVFLLPSAGTRSLENHSSAAVNWLILAPLPEVEVIQPEEQKKIPLGPRPPEAPEFVEASWWRHDVLIRVTKDKLGEAGISRVVVEQDSVGVLLNVLRVVPEKLVLAAEDSSLAAQLFALRVSGGFGFDEIKPLLAAWGKASQRADIMSRAADMYGDFLQQKIMVPDKLDVSEH